MFLQFFLKHNLQNGNMLLLCRYTMKMCLCLALCIRKEIYKTKTCLHFVLCQEAIWEYHEKTPTWVVPIANQVVLIATPYFGLITRQMSFTHLLLLKCLPFIFFIQNCSFIYIKKSWQNEGPSVLDSNTTYQQHRLVLKMVS